MNISKNYMCHALVVLLISFLSVEVMACSCAPKRLIRDWNNNQHVFIADVVDIEVIELADPDKYKAGVEHGYFEVKQIFKGNPDAVTHLVAANRAICCNCSTKLKKGSYLVFASQSGEVLLTTCSPTRSVERLSYHEEVLGLLKNNVPLERYTGIYDNEQGTFLIENELRTTIIREYRLQKSGKKAYIDIQAYPLNNGELFFVESNSETILN